MELQLSFIQIPISTRPHTYETVNLKINDLTTLSGKNIWSQRKAIFDFTSNEKIYLITPASIWEAVNQGGLVHPKFHIGYYCCFQPNDKESFFQWQNNLTLWKIDGLERSRSEHLVSCSWWTADKNNNHIFAKERPVGKILMRNISFRYEYSFLQISVYCMMILDA